MNWIRSLVSQKKKRYIDDDFDLDLTYITPRTIAMAYPADGFESLYRNDIDDVATFLFKKHKREYKIINASCRAYDNSKFHNQVVTMSWPNHYPCPFEHFIEILMESLDYLLKNPSGVLIVHCLAGKGRTGSFLNALHFSAKRFTDIYQANEYYLKKRAVNVTFPSQLRYLQHYVEFYENGVKNFDFENKIIERVILQSDSSDFMLGLDHLITFKDFSKKDGLLAEGKITADFKQLVDPENPKRILYRSECAISSWKDSSATDILIVLKSNGVFSEKNMRKNISFLLVKDDIIELVYGDLDKPNGLPKSLKIILVVRKLNISKENQAKFEKMQKMSDRMNRLKEEVEKANLKRTLYDLDDSEYQEMENEKKI